MSIHEKSRISKKTGKKVTKFYACVYDTETKRHIWGKGKEKRFRSTYCGEHVPDRIWCYNNEHAMGG